jgi:hypothetical protein
MQVNEEVLGPLLFILYISDIDSVCCGHTKLQLFADDAKLWFPTVLPNPVSPNPVLPNPISPPTHHSQGPPFPACP